MWDKAKFLISCQTTKIMNELEAIFKLFEYSCFIFCCCTQKVFKWPVSVVLLDVSLLTCRLLKVSSTQLWPSRKFSVINKHHVRTMDSSTDWMKVMRSRFEALGASTAPREKSETTQNFKTTQIKGASTTLSPGLTKKKKKNRQRH